MKALDPQRPMPRLNPQTQPDRSKWPPRLLGLLGVLLFFLTLYCALRALGFI